MSQFEATVARIPSMTAKPRATLRKNAEAQIPRAPGNPDAHRILEALDGVEGKRGNAADLEVTGLLSWEKHRSGQATFRAFHGEEPVGRIFKRADHSATDKDVYAREIHGQPVPGVFHHIRDAREAGERAFAAGRDAAAP